MSPGGAGGGERLPLTVLGGAVAEHHPQVAAAHVLDGNGHLGGAREEPGVSTREGDTCSRPPRRRDLTFTVSFQHGCFTW